MAPPVGVGEAETHLSPLPARAEAGEGLMICRGPRPMARVPRVGDHQDHNVLCATARRKWAMQRNVTSAGILSRRRGGRAR